MGQEDCDVYHSAGVRRHVKLATENSLEELERFVIKIRKDGQLEGRLASAERKEEGRRGYNRG